jgi:hypothetical protein
MKVFTVLALICCLVLLEVAFYVKLLIGREIRIVKEEEAFKRAEAVDAIPPSLLSNVDDYEHLVSGGFE